MPLMSFKTHIYTRCKLSRMITYNVNITFSLSLLELLHATAFKITPLKRFWISLAGQMDNAGLLLHVGLLDQCSCAGCSAKTR